MKKYFLFFICLAIANTATAEITNPQLPENTMTQLELFSKKTLDLKNDLQEVKQNLKILLILDEEDPSRTAVMLLSESYNKNKALYDRAFKEIENKKNKIKISEIKKILKKFNTSGNN